MRTSDLGGGLVTYSGCSRCPMPDAQARFSFLTQGLEDSGKEPGGNGTFPPVGWLPAPGPPLLGMSGAGWGRPRPAAARTWPGPLQLAPRPLPALPGL